MVRTQIQLDERTYEALRRKAFVERKSLSAVVREIVARGLGLQGAGRKRGHRFGFIGMVRGKAPDVSERHDEYLGEGRRW